jgi:hypothetical protein
MRERDVVARRVGWFEEPIDVHVVGGGDGVGRFAAGSHLSQQVDAAAGHVLDLDAGLAGERLLDRRERRGQAAGVRDDDLLAGGLDAVGGLAGPG